MKVTFYIFTVLLIQIQIVIRDFCTVMLPRCDDLMGAVLNYVRGFVVGSCYFPAGEPTTSAHTTLIHSLVGTDHLLTARLHTLAMDTH